MTCYKIDGMEGFSTIPKIEVRTAGKPGSKMPGLVGIPPPIFSYIIPIAVIPFCPASSREPSYLVGTTCIPGFCYNFGIAEDRIFCNPFQHRWVLHQMALLVST